MAKSQYSLEAVNNLISQAIEVGGEVTTWEGGLLDPVMIELPERYKWQFYLIDVVYLNEWSSCYTITKTNDPKKAQAFQNRMEQTFA